MTFCLEVNIIKLLSLSNFYYFVSFQEFFKLLYKYFYIFIFFFSTIILRFFLLITIIIFDFVFNARNLTLCPRPSYFSNHSSSNSCSCNFPNNVIDVILDRLLFFEIVITFGCHSLDKDLRTFKFNSFW